MALFDGFLERSRLQAQKNRAVGAYLIDPEWARQNPSAAQGALTRAQWNIFANEFKPFETRAVERLLGNYEPDAAAAGEAVEKSYAKVGDMQRRNLSRYGVTVSGEEQGIIDRRNELARTLDVARAENNTRDALEEQRLTGLADMMNLFHGVSASSAENLGAAANMASARKQANQANSAAAKQANMQMLGTGLGLAAAFAFM